MNVQCGRRVLDQAARMGRSEYRAINFSRIGAGQGSCVRSDITSLKYRAANYTTDDAALSLGSAAVIKGLGGASFISDSLQTDSLQITQSGEAFTVLYVVVYAVCVCESHRLLIRTDSWIT
jgi:nitrate/nitrite transporter NarK